MDLAQHIGPAAGSRVVITVDAMAAEIAAASRALVGQRVILIVYGADGVPFADEVRLLYSLVDGGREARRPLEAPGLVRPLARASFT